MTPSPFAPAHLAQLPDIQGCTLHALHAGIRYKERDDMALFAFDEGTQIAGVYTRSLTAAAPVDWCRKCSADGNVRAILVNAGNANAYTGQRGRDDVATLAERTAALLDCHAEDVMICSTGVIGEFLPTDCMIDALPTLVEHTSPSAWEACARAIMTTDTFPKMMMRTVVIGDTPVTINAIAKGSGMIAPDMATMLGFIVTDAAIPAFVLQSLLSRYTQTTFNAITVDSDTSTNDTVLCAATGAAPHAPVRSVNDEHISAFKAALHDIMREMAISIVKDGEGASKFVTVQISGAKDTSSARAIGFAVANSPLVKTALAASDPNWGRIIGAIGKSNQWIDPETITLKIGDEIVTKDGAVHPDYNEKNAAAHMQSADVTLTIDCAMGDGHATIWTCDFTEGYIRINADYRS